MSDSDDAASPEPGYAGQIAELHRAISGCARTAERLDLKFTAYLVNMARESLEEILQGLDNAPEDQP